MICFPDEVAKGAQTWQRLREQNAEGGCEAKY